MRSLLILLSFVCLLTSCSSTEKKVMVRDTFDGELRIIFVDKMYKVGDTLQGRVTGQYQNRWVIVRENEQ